MIREEIVILVIYLFIFLLTAVRFLSPARAAGRVMRFRRTIMGSVRAPMHFWQCSLTAWAKVTVVRCRPGLPWRH